MSIEWKPQMSVGHADIDHDHRYLFSLVNKLELALQHEDDHRMVPSVLAQLLAYTREHFAREELLQAEVGYPLQAEHHAEHQHIVESLARLTGGEEPDHLVSLVREWILGHVLNTDLRMKPYFDQAGRR